MYGGYGYGMGNPGYGGGVYGAPGYGGMGMAPGMGMGMGLQGRYMFTAQMIEMQAFNTFMKYDFNRNGVLNINEVRMALNEFCAVNGQMPVMEPDLMMLFAIFDCDGSGQIDFFEYKMMLEHLGGIRMYDRSMMMGIRAQRASRMQQYYSFW